MAGDRRLDARPGTRVRVFPQAYFLDAFAEPVTVSLGVPQGGCGPGPSDDRITTVVAPDKAAPYGMGVDPLGRPTWSGPPWRGPRGPLAVPGPDGHLDRIPVDDPAFLPAHAYGCARLALDVLEGYLGRLPWHFAPAHDRLEVICVRAFDNAQVGWGFLELGENLGTLRGLSHPFALNLDTVAHEMGHLALFSVIGYGDDLFDNPEYRGFHEAMADLVAFLVAAHLDPVLDQVLRATRGNLYVANELSRVVELSPADQIRNLGHGVTMAPFVRGWSDEHDLSLPLSGAFFDLLVEVYQTLLVEAGLLAPEIIRLADDVETMLAFEHPIQDAYAAAYAERPDLFKAALMDARDVLGHLLAGVWRATDARRLTYAGIARTAAAVERRLTGGRFARAVAASFAWRRIGELPLGPYLPPPNPPKHSLKARAAVPV